jgi:hypothetical protein
MINIRAESLGNGTTREGGPGGVATDRTGNVTNTVPEMTRAFPDQ